MIENDKIGLDSDRFVREVMNRIEKHEGGQSYSNSANLFRSEPDIQLNRFSLKNLLYSDDWVYIVCNLVATKISNQRLHIVEQSVVDGKRLVKPAEDHELQKVLDNPNPQMDQSAFTYVWAIETTLGGNGLVYHAKSNDELWNVGFEKIDPQFDQKNNLTGYSLTSMENEDCLGIEFFKADEIMHAKRPDPSYCYWGLSPFQAGKSSILFNRYSQEFLNSFYLKGASPQLHFELQQDVNERQSIRMLRSFEKAYGSRQNQRRPLITPAGVKAKPITTSLADQQLITYINSNRETIINLLNIPKHELSIQDGGSLGSQEMRLSLRNFWLTTLKPTMRFIEGPLNKHFKERLGDKYRIEFDLSTVEALQDDQIKQAELADRLIKSGAFSPNEVRQRIFREPPRPDGDDLVGTNSRGPQTEPPPATPPNEIPSDGEPIRSCLSGIRKIEVMGMKKQRDDQEKRTVEQIKLNVLDLFLKFLETAIKVIHKNSDGFPLPEKQTENEKITELLRDIETQLIKEFGKNENDFIKKNSGELTDLSMLGKEGVISASFNGGDIEAIQAISDGNEPGRLNTLLDARGIDSFKNISQTSSKKIINTIEQGMRSGSSITAITRSITDIFTDAQVVGSQAEKIARTETGIATMIGREAAFKDAQTALGPVVKIWLTQIDSTTRDTHVGLHLTRASPSSGKFENGLRFPLDPNGDPREIINCRCDMILEKE